MALRYYEGNTWGRASQDAFHGKFALSMVRVGSHTWGNAKALSTTPSLFPIFQMAVNEVDPPSSHMTEYATDDPCDCGVDNARRVALGRWRLATTAACTQRDERDAT